MALRAHGKQIRGSERARAMRSVAGLALFAALNVSACASSCEHGSRPATSPQAPAGAAHPADRGSAAWPGAHGKSGVNGEPVIDRASVEAFCSWRGRPCPIAHVYTDRRSWESMTRRSGWVFDNFEGFPGQLVISQGLVPDEHGEDLAACAAGEHDDDFRAFGAELVERGRADSIVRLGWEFNGGFAPWSGHDPKRWIACYRHAALAIRGADPQVKFDWTIDAKNTPREVCGGVSTNCYPGDDVVDIVGIDNYDKAPSARSAAEFERIAAAPEGLSWLHAFAKRHGKKFSVGEWGVAPDHPYNTTGENPQFIRWMHAWFAEHAADLAYEAYFNHCAGETEVHSNLHLPASPGCPRRNDAAAAVYKALFGAPTAAPEAAHER